MSTLNSEIGSSFTDDIVSGTVEGGSAISSSSLIRNLGDRNGEEGESNATGERFAILPGSGVEISFPSP